MSIPAIDIRPDHWQIVRHILRKHVAQYAVWAFGSRVKWTAKEYSDLDLAIITDKPLSLSASAALSDDFSESDLPWKVDVVDWATTSESFRKIIERDKVVVQRAEAKGAFVSGLPEGKVAHGSTEYIVLSGKAGETDSLFTYYLARSPGFRRYAIGHMEGTSGRQRVPSSAIEKFPVALPPLPEQRAIARILGAFDDKIELNRRTNGTLEAMARALFKSWFVDFDGVAQEDMQESELGLIPKGWRLLPLSDILEIIGGGTPKTSVSEYWGGDIPWFSVVDTPATNDVFVVATEKNITQTGLQESSVRLIPKGTTIISARGTVGNLAIAGRDMTFNQSCYGLRGKNGAGDYFVFLTAQRMVDQLRSMAHGSVFPTITRQTFGAVRIAVPPEGSFARFEQMTSAWFDKILLNVEQSQTLVELRDTLLPRLISGQLRVKQ